MQLFPRPDNQAPPGTDCVEVLTASRFRLRAAFATPKKPRGTVLLMQGRAEFIERYFETMNDLVRRGYAVATFDWRGQGGSQRVVPGLKRGYISRFADFDEDIDAVYSRLMVAHCPKPFYALAHSTGGHMLLRALRGRRWLERAVITSPLLGLPFGTWPEPVARLLAHGAGLFGMDKAAVPGAGKHGLRMASFDANPLTSDRHRFERDAVTLEQHPELATGAPTYAWVRAAMNSIDELQKWPPDLGPSCPALIVVAGQDQVVDNLGTLKFVGRAPGFSSLTIADSRHEILNERNDIRERFLAALEGFIGH